MDRPGALVDNGAAVSARIFRIVPDNLQRAPGLAPVEASLQDHVDIAAVAGGAAFAKREDRSLLRYDQRRYAEGSVTLLTADEYVNLLFGSVSGLPGSAGSRGKQRERGKNAARGFLKHHLCGSLNFMAGRLCVSVFYASGAREQVLIVMAGLDRWAFYLYFSGSKSHYLCDLSERPMER